MNAQTETLAELRRRFVSPSARSRPTPLYWWSGGDIDLGQLEWQLDTLAEKGIGGTVVGYSHLPDGSLDHGSPEPLTSAWWQLFRQFVEASSRRGMTVGLQDYCIIGTVLLRAGEATTGLGAGSLTNSVEIIHGPGRVVRPPAPEGVLSRRAISRDGLLLEPVTESDGSVTWDIPEGEWVLSTVAREPGRIGLFSSEFDPMHPDAGAAVIRIFYGRFLEELGDLLGTTFTTFFQDELDLGLVMPMWNSIVGDRLADAGFDVLPSLHLLWHGDGTAALAFRAAYRDVVVDLLQEHYFRPIFEWCDAHSTEIVMDQLSRGDLRLGHEHYADFMETMAWFHGPGNDDPDLTRPRNIAAFRTSASIAHLNDRPRVMNEAFHSSGWGVTPEMILGGVNIGFAAGANQVMLHGLNATTSAGWWEWASPDFHFRQPWFEHSEPLWTEITRVSELLRAGTAVSEIGIIDPTPELDFDPNATSTDVASGLLEILSRRTLNADLVPQAYLSSSRISRDDESVALDVRHARYRAMVVPAMTTLRRGAADALASFVKAGGVVICVGSLPSRTEFGSLTSEDLGGWHVAEDSRSLIDLLHALVAVDVVLAAGAPDIMCARRSVDGAEIYLFVNPGDAAVDVRCDLRSRRSVEQWDPATGVMEAKTSENSTDPRGRDRRRVHLRLEPGRSELLVQTDGPEPSTTPEDTPATEIDLSSDWTIELSSSLDNRFEDFVLGGLPLPIATYHVETAANADGPWSRSLVDHGARFRMAGPVSPAAAPDVERDILGSGIHGDDLGWRPYPVSLQTGIPDDAYLLDWETGPHGLKGVPDEFLDPAALDPEAIPGSFYYFWSTVESAGGVATVRSRGRAAHTVWVNGKHVIDAPETPAEKFPQWGLRNMESEMRTAAVGLTAGTNVVLVRVEVSAGQPTRVGVAVGGSEPHERRRARLSWWDGEDPAAEFAVPGPPSTGWLRVPVPPGARRATILTGAQLVGTSGDQVLPVPGGYQIALTSSMTSLFVVMRATSDSAWLADAGALRGPVVWNCERADVVLGSWRDAGLSDFSGTGTYRRVWEFGSSLPRRADLYLVGLEGSASISVNGTRAGVAYGVADRVRVDHLLVPGPNELEIECANTLVNHFSRLPSPFSVKQMPGGGFTGVRAALEGSE